MEGGTLLDSILCRGHLTEQEASMVVKDIANGLNFLHKKGLSFEHRFSTEIDQSTWVLIPWVKICIALNIWIYHLLFNLPAFCPLSMTWKQDVVNLAQWLVEGDELLSESSWWLSFIHRNCTSWPEAWEHSVCKGWSLDSGKNLWLRPWQWSAHQQLAHQPSYNSPTPFPSK